MAITVIGDPVQKEGLNVLGPLYINGTKVIDTNGKLLESAGIEIADGDTFDDTNGNEVIEFTIVASAVNHIGFVNAATGNNPRIRAEGEADTGITFDNSEGEEILVLDSVASSVNHVQISSSATGNAPSVAAVGDDANIDLILSAKGTGVVTTDSGLTLVEQSVTPNNDNGAGSTIKAGMTAVDVGAVTNDANDWITLPSLSSVPVGHEILIACNAGGNFELRTPTTSNEKINNVDSDGTQEYLCTDTDTVRVWKVSDTQGWAAMSITNLGAVRTAVVPD